MKTSPTHLLKQTTKRKATAHKPIKARAKPLSKSGKKLVPDFRAHGRPAHLIPEQCGPGDTVAVRLRFYCPHAGKVFVAGDFNRWNSGATALISSGDGEWETVLWLDPGYHEYRYVVDGTWIEDPLSPKFVANPYGELNSAIEVSFPLDLPICNL